MRKTKKQRLHYKVHKPETSPHFFEHDFLLHWLVPFLSIRDLGACTCVSTSLWYPLQDDWVWKHRPHIRVHLPDDFPIKRCVAYFFYNHLRLHPRLDTLVHTREKALRIMQRKITHREMKKKEAEQEWDICNAKLRSLYRRVQRIPKGRIHDFIRKAETMKHILHDMQQYKRVILMYRRALHRLELKYTRAQMRVNTYKVRLSQHEKFVPYLHHLWFYHRY